MWKIYRKAAAATITNNDVVDSDGSCRIEIANKRSLRQTMQKLEQGVYNSVQQLQLEMDAKLLKQIKKDKTQQLEDFYEAIGKLPKLRDLHFRRTKYYEDEYIYIPAFEKLLEATGPRLHTLELTRCKFVGKGGDVDSHKIWELVTNLPSKCLEMNHCCIRIVPGSYLHGYNEIDHQDIYFDISHLPFWYHDISSNNTLEKLVLRPFILNSAEHQEGLLGFLRLHSESLQEIELSLARPNNRTTVMSQSQPKIHFLAHTIPHILLLLPNLKRLVITGAHASVPFEAQVAWLDIVKNKHLEFCHMELERNRTCTQWRGSPPHYVAHWLKRDFDFYLQLNALGRSKFHEFQSNREAFVETLAAASDSVPCLYHLLHLDPTIIGRCGE